MSQTIKLFAVLCTCALLGCNDASQDVKPISVTPKQPPGDKHIETGVALMNQRRFAEAIPHFQRGIEKPLELFSQSEVLTAIGNCYNELGQFEKSLAYHDMALKADPKDYKVLVNKGVVYRLMGDYENAQRSYLSALEIAPDYAEAHMSMGALAIHQEQYQLAIQHLERAIKLNDTVPIGHSNLAFAYAAAGRFDDADRALQRAIVRGYHQPEVIRERIDQLKRAAHAKLGGDSSPE